MLTILIREPIPSNKYTLTTDAPWIVKDTLTRFVDCSDNDKKRDILWCPCSGKEYPLLENNASYADPAIVTGNDTFTSVTA